VKKAGEIPPQAVRAFWQINRYPLKTQISASALFYNKIRESVGL